MEELRVTSLRCEYREHLLGTDVTKPRFSWVLDSDRRATRQIAYQVEVEQHGGDGQRHLIWDSGRVESADSIHVIYAGPHLSSRTRYEYRVKVWDNAGRVSDWSPFEWFETAFLDPSEWRAQWITPRSADLDPASDPVFYLRRHFVLEPHKEVAQARLYATALGVYEGYLNGERIGDEWLTPGWTSYHTRLQYQTYDVTAMVASGSNVVGFVVANGWYKGELAWEDRRNLFGDRRAVRGELHVRYTDGSETVIRTDDTWQASTGPLLYAELYHGERYDARLERPDWSLPTDDVGGWVGVEAVPDNSSRRLIAQENWPIRVTETLQPKTVLRTPKGDLVLDMGQNMVGRMSFTVTAPVGTEIVLEHAEVLDKDGEFYTGNLRKAKQRIVYVAKGDGQETYAAHFTFQGFRYIRITGYPTDNPDVILANFHGEVMHSDMAPTGEFECSDTRINQLQHNIVWGQRGNFVDVPTDCPQRDERLGWTGDAQVFIRTALFNFHGGPFFTKWLRDVAADQFETGGIPHVIPDVLRDGQSSSAWGDAAVICPWSVYVCYADKRLLAEQYPSMRAWVDYIHAQGENEYLWNTGFHFGDWLALDNREGSYVGATPKDLIATAYYAYSTELVAKAAEVLGYGEDARRYRDWHAHVRAEFQREFVTPNGRMASATQTAHVVALMFNLLDGSTKQRAAATLNQLILDHDVHLTTGFVGTPYLCWALSENGYHDTAMKLLLQESYPGWLYSISQGATTIWEHWDGVKPDGSFWSADMNSFNHYAYGAIGDWMYRVVAGLDAADDAVGYRHLRIHPRIGHGLTHARATLITPYGKAVCGWRVDDGGTRVDVTVPANATATVVLSGVKVSQLREGSSDANAANGVWMASDTKDGVVLEIGSGQYAFSYGG